MKKTAAQRAAWDREYVSYNFVARHPAIGYGNKIMAGSVRPVGDETWSRRKKESDAYEELDFS